MQMLVLVPCCISLTIRYNRGQLHKAAKSRELREKEIQDLFCNWIKKADARGKFTQQKVARHVTILSQVLTNSQKVCGYNYMKEKGFIAVSISVLQPQS